MKNDEKIDWTAITKRLDALLYILMKQVKVQEMSTREQIGLLNSIGLKDTEIARIFGGKTRGYIASELSQLRKKKRGK